MSAPLSLFACLVPADGVVVPLVGIQIDDAPGDSFFPFQPVVDAQQVKLWCEAARSLRLRVSFVNELVIPVIEGDLALNAAQADEFSSLLRGWQGSGVAIPDSTQERALDEFERHAKANGGPVSSGQLTVAALRIVLESKEVLRLSLGTSGDFDLDRANEGANLEQTLLELLGSKYPKHTFHNPLVQLGTRRRELTDLLLVSEDALFLFESKVMAVFERGLNVTTEERARRTMKHFRKAIGQLVGAVKQVRSSAPIFTRDGILLSIPRSKNIVIHALMVVSSANLPLDFHKIAAELTGTRSQASTFYHFLNLSELQQHVAFTDSAGELSLFLQRRFEVATGSRNAAIRTRFIRPPIKHVSSCPVAASATDYVFAFMAVPRAAHSGHELTRMVFSALKADAFSGRLELYHRITKRGRDAYYDLGVGLARHKAGQFEMPDPPWWRAFEARLALLINPALGLQLSPHSGPTTLEVMRRDFERVAVMDLENGVGVACG